MEVVLKHSEEMQGTKKAAIEAWKNFKEKRLYYTKVWLRNATKEIAKSYQGVTR